VALEAAPVNAETIFSLVVASIPVVGVAAGLLVVYVPIWRKSRLHRKLDLEFEMHRELWEEELRGMGNERSPEPPA
jgi:hypothetical protein